MLRTCWSHSHWDPFSSGSVTAMWATHSPTKPKAAAAISW
ncbi:HSH2D isoform 6, partial [Pan troglodytes]